MSRETHFLYARETAGIQSVNRKPKPQNRVRSISLDYRLRAVLEETREEFSYLLTKRTRQTLSLNPQTQNWVRSMPLDYELRDNLVEMRMEFSFLLTNPNHQSPTWVRSIPLDYELQAMLEEMRKEFSSLLTNLRPLALDPVQTPKPPNRVRSIPLDYELRLARHSGGNAEIDFLPADQPQTLNLKPHTGSGRFLSTTNCGLCWWKCGRSFRFC